MQNRLLYTLIGLVAAILVLRASLFTVSEGQLAIKSTGGEIISRFRWSMRCRVSTSAF
jgi:regulator of protease activity HflC (stomatin/prohibitin superfamily)